VKIKEKKNDIAMLKEMRRQKKRTTKKIQSKTKSKKTPKTTTKHRKLVHPIKEMNEKLNLLKKLMRIEKLSLEHRDGD
jgi:hypothetical protein